LQLRGNPGKRPINDQEPKPESGVPKKPQFLSATAIKYWHYHARWLDQAGILAKVDLGIFAAYCTGLATLEKAETMLKEGGYTQTTVQSGEKKRPSALIAKVSPGGNLTYAITVTNGGKVTATGVIVSNPLPAGTVFANATTTNGLISAPPVGSNGTVTVNLGSLANGAVATISIVATVTAAPGTVLIDTPTVTATTQDLNSKNNSATQKTTVAKK
jgi:uncharacterized repeat protein (TIGR01451 family)